MPPLLLAALADLHPIPAPGECDEAALIARSQAGDLDAFDTLVARHQAKVYALCLWMLGHPEDAEDAAQTAFVRAFRALPRFRGDSQLGTWLHRIAANVALDTAKRRGRDPRPFSQWGAGDEGDDPSIHVPDAAPQPAEQIARRERQAVVRRALGELPPNHRAVITLFDIEGRSYEEAAAILGVPMGTVKSRLSRARDALRALLEPHRELWEA